MVEKQLTLGSLFDGSGGFPFGGVLAGIVPLWNSEIEPFPVLVTHRRMPGVKHYGDVSKMNGADLPPVDIIHSCVKLIKFSIILFLFRLFRLRLFFRLFRLRLFRLWIILGILWIIRRSC